MIDFGIVSEETIIEILKQKDSSMSIVITGWNCPEELRKHVNSVTTITTEVTDN